MWATSVENGSDRMSLEFTVFRVCGSRTVLGLRLLIRCLCLDQMSLEFTGGFRVAVLLLGLYWLAAMICRIHIAVSMLSVGSLFTKKWAKT